MNWEKIASKDNKLLRTMAKLSASSKARREAGLYICEGEKLLREAVRDGAGLYAVVWEEESFRKASREDAEFIARLEGLDCRRAVVPAELYARVSILENYLGPVFLCRIPVEPELRRGSYIALDGVQDPGNMGTVLRTAEAFGIDGVILLEGCADPYQPKTVRAAMGSLFREKIYRMDADEMFALAKEISEPVYVTALYEDSKTVGEVSLSDCIVIIGSEGRGARRENIEKSGASLFIPMCGKTESLNAAVAASVIMWEMKKCRSSFGYGSAN